MSETFQPVVPAVPVAPVIPVAPTIAPVAAISRPVFTDLIAPGPLLIVEDEPLAQRRLHDVLVSLGYTADLLVFTHTIAQTRALLVGKPPFHMVFVDIGLPDGNGIELIRHIHARNPALPILVVSAWSTEQTIVEAIQAGALGYILKERDEFEISLSIRSALRGGAPIDPFVAKYILRLMGAGKKTGATALRDFPPAGKGGAYSGAYSITPRGAEILALVAKGLSNQEIANTLTLSRLTVGCHIKNIYKKLAVNSRTQAVFEARSSGLLA